MTERRRGLVGVMALCVFLMVTLTAQFGWFFPSYNAPDDVANTFALRSGTNPQVFRVYNSWSANGTTYQRFVIDWIQAGGFVTIGTEAANLSGQSVRFIRAGTEVAQLNGANAFQMTLLATSSNCSSSASPAVCGSAAAGSAVIAAAATSVTVNTTAVTANSQILITEDQSLGAKLSVTCNTQSDLVTGTPEISARVAGTSFTVIVPVAPTTNPICFSYLVVN